MREKRVYIQLFFALCFQLSNAIPFLHDEKMNAAIVPVLDTQGMQWRDDLSYLTYLCMDELGQLCFRTYPFTSIAMPGSYQLAGNVSNQITISASNVTLDMNGHTVSGGTNGIVINSGLSHITIKNGVIDSVSSDGIQVGVGCSNITIKDVEVNSAIRGIFCEQVKNGMIKNCDLNFSTTGLMLDTCHNMLVEDCTARANTHAGFDVLTSTTCSIIECSALSTGNGNSDTTSDVFGFVSSDGNGNIFNKCIANGTQNVSVTDYNSIIAGFGLKQSESGSSIINCESANSMTNPYEYTIPYGIWFEETIDSTQSVAGEVPSSTARVLAMEWSPDGKYIAVGGDQNAFTSNALQIISFDPVAQSITTVATGPSTVGITVLDWSPDGKYVAVGYGTGGIELFTFDYVTKTLTSVSKALTAGASYTSAMNFSRDGNYLVCGPNFTPRLQVFKIDKEKNILSFVTSASPASVARRTRWSPDGRYIFYGYGSGTIIYKFDPITATLTNVASASTGNTIGGEWSPDGNYISTGAISSNFRILKFDYATEALSIVASASVGSQCWSARWSSDGKYIAMSGTLTSNNFQIWKFDKGTNMLTKIASGLTSSGVAYEMAWAPDGRYVAVGGQSITTNLFQVFTGLQFPENNVIKGNTVYCNSGAQYPSGIGISGSSIANSIMGNTAFNNPIPRGANAPIVESNYAFVTNVFNQLFGDAPTALQNVSLSGMNPIWDRYDIPGGLNRLEALAESLIDNLL